MKKISLFIAAILRKAITAADAKRVKMIAFALSAVMIASVLTLAIVPEANAATYTYVYTVPFSGLSIVSTWGNTEFLGVDLANGRVNCAFQGGTGSSHYVSVTLALPKLSYAGSGYVRVKYNYATSLSAKELSKASVYASAWSNYGSGTWGISQEVDSVYSVPLGIVQYGAELLLAYVTKGATIGIKWMLNKLLGMEFSASQVDQINGPAEFYIPFYTTSATQNIAYLDFDFYATTLLGSNALWAMLDIEKIEIVINTPGGYAGETTGHSAKNNIITFMSCYDAVKLGKSASLQYLELNGQELYSSNVDYYNVYVQRDDYYNIIYERFTWRVTLKPTYMRGDKDEALTDYYKLGKVSNTRYYFKTYYSDKTWGTSSTNYVYTYLAIAKSASQGYTGGNTLACWISVAIRHQDGSETTIASEAAGVTRSSDGQGIQSATWNCPQTTLSTTDAIKITVHVRCGPAYYVTDVPFITIQLGATKLSASTWTVYYYTKRVYTVVPGVITYTSGYFYWGINTDSQPYNSRIENILYS